MKKCYLLFLIILLFNEYNYALNSPISSQLSELDIVLESRHVYDSIKRDRIDSLCVVLDVTDDTYSVYKKLYEEYKSYNYDTALIIVDKMQLSADESVQIIETSVCKAFVFLSGGLFKEAYDVMEQLQNDYDSLPIDYYITYARLLYDMADYAGSSMVEKYNTDGNELMLRATQGLNLKDSARYWYPLATIDLRNADYIRSINRFHEALKDSQISLHDSAIYTSSLAFLYLQTGDTLSAISYYIKAAECDARSLTYETVALRMLAELLYEQGEYAYADKYIRIAMHDASRYHARHRQVAISQILPIIEQRNANLIEHRNFIAYILLAIVFLLLVIGLIGILILISRNKEIHKAQQTIDNINQTLMVANKVKEELLSSLMVGHSQYLSAVEKYQTDIKSNVANRRINELMIIPKNVDAHLQRQVLNHRIDEMLLRIFPTFVNDFNQLLRPNERFVLKKDELLNTQLRIFALMRLGIVHHEVIAEILDNSINTIYTYKTRTINRSDLSAEQFYEALMSIPSFAPLK